MIENRIETHRRIVKTIFEQAWSRADFNGIDDFIAEDAVFHIRKLDLPTNAIDLERIVSGWHMQLEWVINGV